MDHNRDKRGKFSTGGVASKRKRTMNVTWTKRNRKLRDHDYFNPAAEREGPETVTTTNLPIASEVTLTPSGTPVRHFSFPSNLRPMDDYREIVELSLLADALEACYGCGSPLHLIDSIGIQPKGLSGILYVTCRSCGIVKMIHLGKRHVPGSGHNFAYDINTKAAEGKHIQRKLIDFMNFLPVAPNQISIPGY